MKSSRLAAIPKFLFLIFDICIFVARAVVVLLVFAAVMLLSCTSSSDSEPADIDVAPIAEGGTQITGGPPPLVVDTSAPLLLDEPTEEQKAFAAAATEAAAENMACFVCHANYRGEFIAQRHAKANVGCVNCHGDSFAHRNDENNTTPPVTMYSADKIDAFCRGCHESHDVSPRMIVARWAERNLDKTDPDRIVCTDCHGEHRMKVRTVIWDKKTGKLLRTNRGD